MKTAIAIDAWKLPYFTDALNERGFQFTTEKLTTDGSCLTLNLEIEDYQVEELRLLCTRVQRQLRGKS